MKLDYFFDDNLQDHIDYNFCKRKKKIVLLVWLSSKVLSQPSNAAIDAHFLGYRETAPSNAAATAALLGAVILNPKKCASMAALVGED